MSKLLIILLCMLFPVLVFADDSLTFAPPTSDYSVIFLGNLFGIVDGVLHGTGSQIMGVMFGVFNSAVLALGGVVIIYTLLVATMNTAHEGQMLGQKWSSIWIPVRSTLGLALLIPKASGYCLMQIFVMWIVIQGVGAADKIWAAALGYLNRGGVIVHAEPNNAAALLEAATPGGKTPPLPAAATTILLGQVCMLGLQRQLNAQQQNFNASLQNNSGPCYPNDPSNPMYGFCTTPVPDFLGSVNAVKVQTDTDALNADSQQISKGSATSSSSTPTVYEARMPNIDSTSIYSSLDGICGSIKWHPIKQLQGLSTQVGSGNAQYNGVSLTGNQLGTAQLTRAIAIQQMYMDLSSAAQVMVNNDPDLSNTNLAGVNSSSNFSLVAMEQFGVPYNTAGAVCVSSSSDANSSRCSGWGPLPVEAGSGGVLFTGSELVNAMSDYTGVMAPTLNLISSSNNSSNYSSERAFIQEANTSGWIMAGSYFFDLVALNGNAASPPLQDGEDSGLEDSKFDMENVIGTNPPPEHQGWLNLRNWLQNDNLIYQVEALIDGVYLQSKYGVPVRLPPLSPPALAANSRSAVDGLASSTVYGFINNSLMMQTANQPGLSKLNFANKIHFSTSATVPTMPHVGFSCGGFMCIPGSVIDILYNYVIVNVYNVFYYAFFQIIQQIIMAFIQVPLGGMAGIFTAGLKTISQPGVNPVVGLAQMGVAYINFSGNLWFTLMDWAITSALIPIFGWFIFPMLVFVMPLILAWLGVMTGIGFITAYYVPILPYLMFVFGSIAWLMSVIEAMVAAPIVAWGITHPEGHEAFGKGEPAIMILLNVFLRPSMMIIGYISGIALCYVGVWVLNAGFEHAISYIQTADGTHEGFSAANHGLGLLESGAGTLSGEGGYSDWAGIYAFFFSILVYTSTYLVIVQKSFSMINSLPDRILRWIGGTPESWGQEANQWGEETKSKIGEAGKGTQDAQGQMEKKLGGAIQTIGGQVAGAAADGTQGDGGIKAQGGGAKAGGGGGGGSQIGPSTVAKAGETAVESGAV